MRKTQNLLIAVGLKSNPRPSEAYFYFILLHFLELFFVVFSLVFAMRSFDSMLTIIISMTEDGLNKEITAGFFSSKVGTASRACVLKRVLFSK